MPELQNNPASRSMHGIGHLFPPGHLGVGMNAGLAGTEGGISLHDHGGFRDDEACGGPLGVIGGHEVRGNMVSVRSASGERRHEDAIWEFDGAEVDRGEKGGGGHDGRGGISGLVRSKMFRRFIIGTEKYHMEPTIFGLAIGSFAER